MTELIYASSGGNAALAQDARVSANLRRMVGSGILVAVGYIDPGNWATDIAGGSGFGYGLLMVVITSVATDTRAVGQAAAIAIGGTIGLEALFAGPISGASINPARSFAPALVSGTWQDHWVYVAGPAIGAVIGVSVYTWIRAGAQPRPTVEPVGSATERDGHPVRSGSG